MGVALNNKRISCMNIIKIRKIILLALIVKWGIRSNYHILVTIIILLRIREWIIKNNSNNS